MAAEGVSSAEGSHHSSLQPSSPSRSRPMSSEPPEAGPGPATLAARSSRSRSPSHESVAETYTSASEGSIVDDDDEDCESDETLNADDRRETAARAHAGQRFPPRAARPNRWRVIIFRNDSDVSTGTAAARPSKQLHRTVRPIWICRVPAAAREDAGLGSR